VGEKFRVRSRELWFVGQRVEVPDWVPASTYGILAPDF
jgi:hypothetical protein